MKISLALVAWLAATIISGVAQSVSVEVVLDQEQYIANEELVAKVRITNFSGQTLALGKEEDWLTFSLDGGPKRYVAKRAAVPVPGEFKVESAQIATRRVNLAPHFDLAQPGRYSVTATVRIPQLNLVVKSKPRGFNIINGTLLWEQEFGLPPEPGATNGTPDIRKYALLQVTQEKELKMYVRLSNANGTRTYKVFPVGPLVSVSQPEGQLDRFNNLHLLYQTGARSFLYSVISPDGLLISRETHDISNSRPALRATREGRIVVAGGTRRYASNDVPPALDAAAAVDATPRQP